MSSSSWFLYIVQCADGRLYTGITTDVARRFSEHSGGGVKAAKALRGKGPLRLVYQRPMAGRSEASIVEGRVKKMLRSEKLALIAGQLNLADAMISVAAENPVVAK